MVDDAGSCPSTLSMMMTMLRCKIYPLVEYPPFPLNTDRRKQKHFGSCIAPLNLSVLIHNLSASKEYSLEEMKTT